MNARLPASRSRTAFPWLAGWLPAMCRQVLALVDIQHKMPAHRGAQHFRRPCVYAYHLMARTAGINMADCRLMEESGRAHFMTRRFDREAAEHRTIKHHVQTLCAMDHLDYKQRATHAYAQLFMVIAKLRLGDDAIGQAFRRMAFNVMAKNCDDHTKNFAFRLKQGEPWELAPAYDVTHAFNPKGEWTYPHLMSVNGKFSAITCADLLLEAERFGVRRPLNLLADVRAALENWHTFAKEAGLSATTTEGIAADFEPL